MVISDRLRCIFVHVQKTGGASIEAALRAGDPTLGSGLYEGRRHMGALDVRTIAGAERWRDYFKFAFVRNPWDRLVSWHSMCMQTRVPNAFSRYVREQAPTFEAFVKTAVTGPGARTTVNQLDYLTDAAGAVLVDFVGRYETLAADYARISERLALPSTLPRVNESRHPHYRERYSDETRDIVARRFARDIEHFGYAF